MPRLFDTPTRERPHPAGGGVQRIYEFDNGFSASVVRFTILDMDGSYGATEGKWELAVLGHDGHLRYDTPITDDVIGWLDDAEVEDLLKQIKDLPPS